MKKEEIAGNRDTGLLKMIALVCMIIDHVGARIYPEIGELRVIGRIAFPLYIWCMAVGASYTSNPIRYALRLLLVGLVTQPFFMLGLSHSWTQWNVFATLFFGYLGILGIRTNKYGSRIWAPLIVLLIPCFVTMDYGWRGVLLIMLLYLVRGNRWAILAVMVPYCLFWGSNTYTVQRLCGIELANLPVFKLDLFKPFLRIQAMAILSLPLILWPRRERTPFPKVLAYAAYPAHLAVLWLIQMNMGLVTKAMTLHLLMPWWK
ncbi:MAG: hypothetical protein IK133_03400 [Clostridia bacterium]|nr:hypothetical protein [Clostridia bacterium]